MTHFLTFLSGAGGAKYSFAFEKRIAPFMPTGFDQVALNSTKGHSDRGWLLDLHILSASPSAEFYDLFGGATYIRSDRNFYLQTPSEHEAVNYLLTMSVRNHLKAANLLRITDPGIN